MRIAVLAHNLSAGGGRYLGEFIVSLLLRERPRDVFLVTCPERGWRALPENSNARVISAGVSFSSPLKRSWREAAVLRREVKRFHPDVVFAVGNFGLLHPPCRQLILVHQSHLVYDRQHYGPLSLWARLNLLLKKSYFSRQLLHTETVLCQTEVMAARVRDRYGFRGALAILPNVLTPNHDKAESPSAETTALVESQPSDLRLAFVTRYYPHKNLEGLVQAFAEHSSELHGVTVFLTLDRSGADGGGVVLKRIAASPATNHIVNLGPIPQSAVGWLLPRVDGVIVPTLLESFSASYLEAMQHGKPILTSDLDFARCVCGDAASYFDPWDAASMAAAIRRIRDDEPLRLALGQAAKERLPRLHCTEDQFIATLSHALDGHR